MTPQPSWARWGSSHWLAVTVNHGRYPVLTIVVKGPEIPTSIISRSHHTPWDSSDDLASATRAVAVLPPEDPELKDRRPVVV
jgi:hypothetical protein